METVIETPQDKIFTPLPAQTSPAVSVIIPLYNAEEYIGECLDSLLIQTFQDFEVIVVDDCSTDNSVAIVESYKEKFGERLRLYHLETNSGNPGTVRNFGLNNSIGEYIYCLDSDDMIIETALSELYTLAKEFDVDVIYCEKYYQSDEAGKNTEIKIAQSGDLVDEPTLETEDLTERVQAIINSRFWSVPWLKMVRRKLVTDNEIFFPALKTSEDNIWTQGLIFYAKKFLRVPNAIYIYRQSENSSQRTKRTPQQKMNFWLHPVLFGLKSLDELMRRHEFFQENPSCRYKILEKFLEMRFDWIHNSAKYLSSDLIYETIKDEFGKYFGEYDVTASALCAYICEKNKRLKDIKQELNHAEDETAKDKQLIAELENVVEELNGRLKTYNNLPAISVIIPMYNAEEYVSECLDSLLIQTFQNFEVIVVDDCSTDRSPSIVKSYMAKFDGRLTIAKTEKNSGGGGYAPRNMGFRLARGEYVIFVDSDDFLLGTALETLYNAAKEYDVEVVYFSNYYEVSGINKVRLHRDGLGRKLFNADVDDKITLISDNRHKLFQNFIVLGEGEGNFHHPWSKFVRRDFLLKNEIFFPNDIMVGGDCLWCVNVYAYAKKFLRLPMPLYFYRCYNDNSITRTKRTPFEQTYYWISAAVAFLKRLNELQNKIDFLRENPFYCHKIAEKHFQWYIFRISKALEKFTNRDIYEILTKKFDTENDVFEATAPFFFNVIDEQHKEILDNLLIRKLSPYITARIDIRLVSEIADENDFQVLYMSDEKAKVEKPAWFNKNGIGYVIQSYAGKLEIVAQATADGQLELDLKGMDVRNPKGKPKRIPYWIDYTKLTVNGEIIFDKLTPAWHDKSYTCKLDAKAGEEITIQVYWLPHRSDN